MVLKHVGPYGGYGWKRGLPDFRLWNLHTHPFSMLSVPEKLPDEIDLSTTIDWIYDQGKEGSCTGQSSASLAKFVWRKDLQKDVNPSRNFIYWCERDLEGDTDQDAGADLHDGMKVLQQTGFCLEETWDYNDRTMLVKPPLGCYTQAQGYRCASYFAINQERDKIQSALVAGYPFVFGFTVYDSFEDDYVAQTGLMPMPNSGEDQAGGHAVLCVGYNNKTSRYKVMNSWGSSWGDKGYFYMPYEYLESPQLADSLLTIRVTNGAQAVS